MENDHDTKFDDAVEAGESFKSEEEQTAFNKATVGTPPLHEQRPPEPPPADAHCPNCNGPGIRKGKTIVCEKCDAAFRFTKEGPRVEELGPFDKMDARVTALEEKTGSGRSERRS